MERLTLTACLPNARSLPADGMERPGVFGRHRHLGWEREITALPHARGPGNGKGVCGLAGKRSVVMFENHGPVVAEIDVEAACNAIEKREDTTRLTKRHRCLVAENINASAG